MVSIVIITGGLLFVMRVYSTAREAINRSRALFRHSLLLEEGMFEFDEKGESLEGKKEKEFADRDDKGYFWTAYASPLLEEDGTENQELNILTLDVYQKGKSAASGRYSVTTILQKPAK